MTVLKGAAADGFIRRPPPEAVCALVYGGDAGLVREKAGAIVKAVTGSLDDAFRMRRLDEQQLAQDPGRLAAEFDALPFTGGRGAVWIGDAGQAFVAALEPLLVTGGQGNLIVAQAGELPKASRLRTVCEASEHVAVIPVFEDGAHELEVLIDQHLRSAGLSIAADARLQLAGLLGGGRFGARQQLEKLASYCSGQRQVTLADVDACCGDASRSDPDDLIDAALAGELADTQRSFTRLLEAGATGSRLVSLAALHLARLQRFRLDIDRGRSAQDIVRTARPPVFYQRQPAIARQLQALDGAELAVMIESVALAVRHCREYGPLEESVAGRAFLSLARLARSGRIPDRG